jgi:hypothetical protein
LGEAKHLEGEIEAEHVSAEAGEWCDRKARSTTWEESEWGAR